MPRWTPASKDGKPVDCTYTIPVSFKLQGDKKKEDKDNIKVVAAGTIAKDSEAAKDASTLIIHSEANPQSKGEPVIYLNGELYAGNIHSINSSDIESITVKKNDSKHSDGAIYITLKAK